MFLAEESIRGMKEPCGWPTKKGGYSWVWRRLAEDSSWLLHLPACVCLQQGNDLQGVVWTNSTSIPSRHWDVFRAEWSMMILHWLLTICIHRTWKEFSSETKVGKGCLHYNMIKWTWRILQKCLFKHTCNPLGIKIAQLHMKTIKKEYKVIYLFFALPSVDMECKTELIC